MLDLIANLLLTKYGVMAGLVTFLYFYLNKKYSYWSSRGIRGPRPLPIIGNFLDPFIYGTMEYEEANYAKYGKLYGVYEGLKPVLRVGDPELIKLILVKDFNFFVNHRPDIFHEKAFDQNLFGMHDEQWRRCRPQVSPSFTTGRMKRTFAMAVECADSAVAAFQRKAAAGEEIDVFNVLRCYTLDVLGRIAFGVRFDSQTNPDNEFIRMSDKLFNFGIKATFGMLFPKLANKLGIKMLDQEASNYFYGQVRAMLRQRMALPDKGAGQFNDFIQIVINSRNKIRDDVDREEDETGSDQTKDGDTGSGLAGNGLTGSGLTGSGLTGSGLTGSENRSDQKKNGDTGSDPSQTGGGDNYISDDEVETQAVGFLLDGMFTSALTMSFLFWELAMNQEIQDRLVQEIEDTVAEGKEVSYDQLAQMPFLDALINENLRKQNIGFNFERCAGADYRLPCTEIVIKKDQVVQMPLWAMQRSEEFFEKPHDFWPDRFLPENKDRIKPYTFLPFGVGPRMCIGYRLALLMQKLVIIKLFRKLRLSRSKSTTVPLEFKSGVFLMLKKPIFLGASLR